MTRSEALARLPEMHREILIRQADGFDHGAIAADLGLDIATVPSLVVVANRKLDRLLDQESAPGGTQ